MVQTPFSDSPDNQRRVRQSRQSEKSPASLREPSRTKNLSSRLLADAAGSPAYPYRPRRGPRRAARECPEASQRVQRPPRARHPHRKGASTLCGGSSVSNRTVTRYVTDVKREFVN